MSKQATISSDEIDNIQDYIRGTVILLNNMLVAHEGGIGEHEHEQQKFLALQSPLHQALKCMDDLKDRLDGKVSA